MTHVADRRWGHSLVRAPMAREAAEPGVPAAAEPSAGAARRRAADRTSRVRNAATTAPGGVIIPRSRRAVTPEPNIAPSPDSIPMTVWDTAAVTVWDAALLGGGRLPVAPEAVDVSSKSAPRRPASPARANGAVAPTSAVEQARPSATGTRGAITPLPATTSATARPGHATGPASTDPKAPANRAPAPVTLGAATPASRAPVPETARRTAPARRPPVPAQSAAAGSALVTRERPDGTAATSPVDRRPTTVPASPRPPLADVPRLATDDEIAARLGRLPALPHSASEAAVAKVTDTHTGVAPPATDEASTATREAEATDELSLGRLARGVQDCARALSGLSDRLDRLERRFESAATPAALRGAAPSRNNPGDPSAWRRLTAPDRDDLETRLRALEGMAADRLQGIDQRVRRLETLPASVGRLQKDTAWLTDLATSRRIEAAATKAAPATDLAPVYQELDSVADLVSSHHAAATQSLERVRTLERAVLEMRRHLERNLSEHSRVATSEQATVGGRVERLESRLSALEVALSPTGPPPAGGGPC